MKPTPQIDLGVTDMETMMRSNLLVSAGFAAVAMALASTAQAAPLGLLSEVPGAANQSLAQTVDYRNYCGRWRAECTARWPARGWRWRRCLSYRGCL